MKKKIITLLIALVLVLTSCGNTIQEVKSKDENTFTIGLVQLTEHPSLNEIRNSFTEEMEALGKAEGYTIKIVYKNANNDTSLISSICRNFVEDDVDVIVGIATPSVQGAAAVTKEIPIVFSAVTDPVAAGLLTNVKSPEGNITGTSDAIPVKDIFELAEELTPGIKKVGLLYNKGESNSVSVIAETKEYLDSVGITYMERTVSSTGEVSQASRTLAEECDAIFAPIDNTVASAMGVLAKEGIANKVPVYVAADSMVHDGGLATVGVNYKVLGKQTAAMVLEVLEGTPIKDMPVQVMENPQVVINEETAKALGIDISKYEN